MTLALDQRTGMRNSRSPALPHRRGGVEVMGKIGGVQRDKQRYLVSPLTLRILFSRSSSMATADIFPLALDPQNQNWNLDIQIQNHVRDHFWPGTTTSLSEFISYFRYFQWTLSVLLWPNVAVEKASFTVQKYEDLGVVVQCMNEHFCETRAEIAARLQNQFPHSTQDRILRSMDLAIRLWMTLHTRSRDAPIGPSLSDVTIVEWKNKQSLRNLVAGTFPRCRRSLPSPAYHRSHIEPGFNIMNLRKICRTQVQWTQNLKDHLRFDHSTRTLYIYPHKVCLLNHLEWSNAFPKDFLLETIRTLDLLFPFGDRRTELWLEERNQPFHRTSSSYMQARASKLEEFCYWRPQLLELYHIYQQPPVSILQMWHDRRNPMQWYTFWLAALIAILSLVFGSLGTYIGFKQIELAERSMYSTRDCTGQPDI